MELDSKFDQKNYIGKPIDAILRSYKELGEVTTGLVGKIYNPFVLSNADITEIDFDNRIRLQIVGLICSPALKQYNHALLGDLLTTDELGIIDAQFTKAANERKAGSSVAELLSHIYSQTESDENHLVDFQELAGILGSSDESNAIIYYMDEFLRNITSDEKNEVGIILLATLFARVVGAELVNSVDQSEQIEKLVVALGESGYLYNLKALGEQPVELVNPLEPAIDTEGTENDKYLSDEDETHTLPGVPVLIDKELSDLLNRAVANDQEAIGALYLKYADKIRAYIHRRTGIDELADDLTSDVFTKMLEAIRSNKGWKSSFSGWLYRIAHNRYIDYYRWRDRNPNVSMDEALISIDADSHPFENAARSETADKLRYYISRLTQEQSEVVTLRFLEGYSISEVAEILNINEGAVKARQYRGVEVLRLLMQSDFSDEYTVYKKIQKENKIERKKRAMNVDDSINTIDDESMRIRKTARQMIEDRERRAAEAKESERKELAKRREERRQNEVIQGMKSDVHPKEVENRLEEIRKEIRNKGVIPA